MWSFLVGGRLRRKSIPSPFYASLVSSLLPVHSLQIFLWLLLLSHLDSKVDGIMRIPQEPKDVYSLFPHEDLNTGKSLVRFPDNPTRSRSSSARDYDRSSNIFRSSNHDFNRQYNDREVRRDHLYRSPEYSDNRGDEFYRHNRNRNPRVYFPDQQYDKRQFMGSSFDRHSHNSPSSAYPYDPYRTRSRPVPNNDVFPTHPYPPAPFPESKVPPRRESNINNHGGTRVHVFDPVTKSFVLAPANYRHGDPRYKIPTRDGSFVEIGAPGPNQFKDHEAFLEYHRRITAEKAGDSKKLLFTGKQPYEIENELRHEGTSSTTTTVRPNVTIALEEKSESEITRFTTASAPTTTTGSVSVSPRVVVLEYENKRRESVNGKIQQPSFSSFPSSTVKSDRTRIPLSFKFSRFDNQVRSPVPPGLSGGRNLGDQGIPILAQRKQKTVDDEIVQQVESSRGEVLHTNGFVPITPFHLYGE